MDDLLEQANEAVETAEAAAEAAREAAAAAGNYADAVADTIPDLLSAATGGAIDPFVFQLAIFGLAIFVGYYVVWSVTPALHTPLMSVTNAISSVIVVGALLAVGTEIVPLVTGGELSAGIAEEAGSDGNSGLARTFGAIALVLAAVNIVGGFMVTQRMLALYKKKPTAGQS